MSGCVGDFFFFLQLSVRECVCALHGEAFKHEMKYNGKVLNHQPFDVLLECQSLL